MKKRNGFTLVELLAVIVILAIILAIAIPSISGIVDSTKKSAFESDARMLITGLEYQILQSTVGTAAVSVADDLNLKTNPAHLPALGADANNYDAVFVVTKSPLTICVEAKSTSKFGARKAIFTKSTITDLPTTAADDTCAEYVAVH